jgi:hypothetical protein
MSSSTFECEAVWPNASIDNSLISCLANATHLATLFNTTNERAEVAGTLVPLALVVIVVIWFPIFLSLRYCVDFCGSYKRRPGYFCYGGEEWDDADPETKNHHYSSADAGCLRATAYLSLFLSFIPMTLLLVGTGDIQAGYNAIFAELFEIVGWAEAKQTQIRELVTYPNSTEFIPPMTNQILVDVATAVNSYDNDLRKADDINKQLIDVIKTVSIVFAILPVVSLLANALFATFDIRKCWPLVNSFFHFILLCFYAVIASAVLLLGVMTDRICGERDHALHLRPGIGTYWMVPACEANSDFAPVIDSFAYGTEISARAACQKLADHCSSASPVYNGAAPAKIFYCPLLVDPQTQCKNNTEARLQIDDSTVVLLTGGNTCSDSPCKVRNCRQNCSDSGDRLIANEIIFSLQNADRLQAAETLFVADISNCTRVVQTTMTYFKSCGKIKTSVFFVGVGSCIFVGMFIIGMFVIFRGQKRFFKPISDGQKKNNLLMTGGSTKLGASSTRSPGTRSPATRSPRSKSPGSASFGGNASKYKM